MKVCVALLLAGAEDDDVWAVFTHCPIGAAGQLTEAGPGYLERTLARATRTWPCTKGNSLPACPPTKCSAKCSARCSASCSVWLHAVDLAEYVPPKKQCVTGYRTREIDLAVARLEELVMVEDGTITLDPERQARLEEQSSVMPTRGNGGRRIVAEAWRLLASCHVAVEQAIRAGLPVPEWVRRRQTRAWADLERYAPMSPLSVPSAWPARAGLVLAQRTSVNSV